jgi:VWFA-related protein
MSKGILPVLLLFAHFQGLSAQEAQYDVSVTSITIWVKAVDKDGKPVRGMQQADFLVFEDGQQVSVNCFEEVDTQQIANSVEGQTSPKKFVIFLDLFNTTPPEYRDIKPFLEGFLRTLGGKNVEVMLATFTPLQKLGVVVPFTRDLNRIRILLGRATANPMRDIKVERRMDELARVFEGATGDTLEDIVVQGAHDAESLANQEQADSMLSLHALESFASYLGIMQPGEQVVVLYVSGGFSADPGRRYYDIIDRIAERNMNNEVLKFLGQRRNSSSFNKELKKSVGRLNRSNVAVYTINTRGVTRWPEYKDSLIGISQETGGLAFYNTRNFGSVFDQVLEDISHQYVLCYSPPKHQKSEQYHRIKVETVRSGVQLRHRQGYFE